MVRFETEVYEKREQDLVGVQVIVSEDTGRVIDTLQVTNKLEFDELVARLDTLNEKYVQFSANSPVSGESIEDILKNIGETIPINATVLNGLSSDDFSKTNHKHDDRYFTQAEVTSKLTSKANVNHTHSIATLETDGFLSKQDKAKLDNLSYDSDWQEVTFKPGYSRYNDSSSVYIRRKGDFVELNGVWKSTSKKSAASNPVPFASIPIELKPKKSITITCPGQGKHNYRLTVDTDANLRWSQYGINTSIGLETSSFGHVHCMWMI